MFKNELEIFENAMSLIKIDYSYLTIKKESDKIYVRQIVQGNILYRELKQNNFFKDELEKAGFKLQINREESNSKKFDKILNEFDRVDTEDDEKIEISFSSEQCFSVPNDKLELCLFLSDKLDDLIIKLAGCLKIKDIKGSLYKVSILSKEHNLNSEIINVSPKAEDVRLSEDIINLINNEIFEDDQLNVVPFLFPEELGMKGKRELAVKQLNKIFEENKDGKFLLYRRGLKYIDGTNLELSFGTCYKEISRLGLFIGSDVKYYMEKLYIMRKILFDALDDKKKYLDSDFWQRIHDQTRNDFCLFIDDEVINFISEKKDIIKEQYMLSKELTNQISALTKNLTTNIIFITTVFVSKFFIDGLNKSNSSIGDISLYLGLIISIIYLLLFLLAGEKNVHISFEKKLELMVKEFPKLYLTNDNLLIDLKMDITTPELKRLKRMECVALCLYLVIILVFLSFIILL
ncbi:hypothetical protein [Listeria monocytogenes]|uniref:hypothetical protein n=1 Tax=Listeria monocytogenes TaxID=1639 RepID=UPI0011EB9782|nr:hypothetical protein [Listeria monocytogenes]EAF5740453.1 hypothetical protein [Listeria monocytogenes]TYW15204.1 hypothetical protein FZ047_02805 [Listeria monocytogenes]